MNNIKVRKKVRKRMIDLGIKVSDIANEIGVSVAYASNYLTGYVWNEMIEERMRKWYEENKPRRRKNKKESEIKND